MAFGTDQNREAKSIRIKAALAAAKARGVKLGGTNLQLAQQNGAKANKARADKFAANVLPIIERIQANGATSLRAIAAELDAQGVLTDRGGKWAAQQVLGILRRAGSGQTAILHPLGRSDDACHWAGGVSP